MPNTQEKQINPELYPSYKFFHQELDRILQQVGVLFNHVDYTIKTIERQHPEVKD